MPSESKQVMRTFWLTKLVSPHLLCGLGSRKDAIVILFHLIHRAGKAVRVHQTQCRHHGDNLCSTLEVFKVWAPFTVGRCPVFLSSSEKRSFVAQTSLKEFMFKEKILFLCAHLRMWMCWGIASLGAGTLHGTFTLPVKTRPSCHSQHTPSKWLNQPGELMPWLCKLSAIHPSLFSFHSRLSN